MEIRSLLLLSMSFVGVTTAAMADDTPEIVEEVVVIAHPLAADGLSQASSVLTGQQLHRNASNGIGDTLGRQPGIQSAQFGSAVSRPVIRGLAGPRVRIMEDRIDALDVSVTSADHAVTIEPFLAERIEVLKGSSTLLYGSGAIGGVVDIDTGRIPSSVPDAPITGGVETRYDDASDGNNTIIKLNGGIGEHFAWHLDGNWKDGDDYEIPGFAESRRLRALEEEEHEEGEEEHEEEEEARGELPGSAFDFESYAGGVSYVDDWGFFGVAVSRIEADYGLPGGHEHEHEGEEGGEEEEEEEEGNPILDMEQTRIDLELDVRDPFGPFNALNLRLGINDYEHTEIEGNGEAAIDYSNEAWELRGELTYEEGNWLGVVGFQHNDREFSAIGFEEEAFTPPVDSTDTGIFWLGERSFDNWDLETGVRVGRVEHDPEANSSESFTTYAFSIGAVVPLSDSLRLGLLLDQSSRAPISEELYSNGPHIATNAFEIGDPNLDNEVATGLSATLNFTGGVWEGEATVYYNRFSDFIYEQANGEVEDGLPVYEWLQDDADFMGVDLEASVRVAQWEGGEARVRGMFDYVSAEVDISGDDDLPRIPPLRYGGGVSLQFGPVLAAVDYLRVQEQRDTAEFELRTDSYNDLRVYIGADIPVGETTVGVFLHGKNLTDDEQRNHASFIKDVAPAPGRTVEAGVRIQF